VSRRLVALGIAAVFAAGAGAALAADANPPYAKRLQILAALATRYPGHVEKGNPLGKYGLWAGIYVQTAWQQQSHRDRVPLWGIVNYHLSVEPTTYARLLEKAGSGATPGSVCALTLSGDVCRAWVGYFVATKQHLKPASLLKLLWRAHTNAIANALRSQRAQFDAVRTTPLERRFWASWIEIVFLLEAARFPTDGDTSARASTLLMPPCSPLGAPGCTLRPRDLGRSYAFVSFLAHRNATIDRALREYTTLRQNPDAVRTLALTDPTLAAALGLYLAVAR
jgi:hypothetical protein